MFSENGSGTGRLVFPDGTCALAVSSGSAPILSGPRLRLTLSAGLQVLARGIEFRGVGTRMDWNRGSVPRVTFPCLFMYQKDATMFLRHCECERSSLSRVDGKGCSLNTVISRELGSVCNGGAGLDHGSEPRGCNHSPQKLEWTTRERERDSGGWGLCTEIVRLGNPSLWQIPRMGYIRNFQVAVGRVEAVLDSQGVVWCKGWCHFLLFGTMVPATFHMNHEPTDLRCRTERAPKRKSARATKPQLRSGSGCYRMRLQLGQATRGSNNTIRALDRTIRALDRTSDDSPLQLTTPHSLSTAITAPVRSPGGSERLHLRRSGERLEVEQPLDPFAHAQITDRQDVWARTSSLSTRDALMLRASVPPAWCACEHVRTRVSEWLASDLGGAS